jgi:kynurenine formamidase
MVTKITHKCKSYIADLSKPIDISIPLRTGDENVNAWYVNPVTIEPVRMGDWVGDVKQGGSVNFRNITFNPHGNGTHTECVGHISKQRITINEVLKQFMFLAQVITVIPQLINGDFVLVLKDVEPFLHPLVDALVIRTLPNDNDKLVAHYSGNNPAYLQPKLCTFLRKSGVKHLVIDLPSVDREEDSGALEAHHAFWNFPEAPRLDSTITEMAYIPNHIEDDIYLLNLQIASLQTDASPSKPVLYKIEHVL